MNNTLKCFGEGGDAGEITSKSTHRRSATLSPHPMLSGGQRLFRFMVLFGRLAIVSDGRRCLVAVLLLLLGAHSKASGPGVVDVERVFSESWMGSLAQRALADQFVEREASLRRRTEELAVVRSSLEEGQLSPALVNSAVLRLTEAEHRLMIDRKLLDAERSRRGIECYDELFRRVRVAVEGLAKEAQADFILDSALYVRPSADWTTEVVQALNEESIPFQVAACTSRSGLSSTVPAP
ncbi:OmpH family outer membrane protein [Variovorax sp. J22P240]|uniref:OmpH family outer membrane protein n=1 Tax=Variovorax sp. J22P240 TaxID=3053514 RepID=UPI002575FCF2|nr:OmpH family outer membrane protein [Variovorax sp. J22P240]MDM0002766.1 OmpH family outer membrane protein [Variovorax sp. J22P240]